MRLLEAMSSLADGDLRVEATVSDDVTGAIADAVNYAVERLRELVEGINSTAQQVGESATLSEQVTSRLAQESTAQAERVAQSTSKVKSWRPPSTTPPPSASTRPRSQPTRTPSRGGWGPGSSRAWPSSSRNWASPSSTRRLFFPIGPSSVPEHGWASFFY